MDAKYLAEIKAAEDGKIVELPCKVGDTVFTIYVSGSGLTLFPTREAAEQALKERET